jgi:MFS family permease
MERQPAESGYRWLILVLAALTNTLATAVPGMCMPVLFAEISKDLNLNLVQVGMIWGISALPGIFTVLLGGAIGDRFGPRRVLIIGCALVGLAGALRGLAVDFVTLAAAMFLLGMISPLTTMNTVKTCGIWFSRRQLGLASGFLSLGMAFGFLITSLLSASVLSPLLGGWRHVLFLYGGITAVLSLFWLLTRSAPAPVAASSAAARPASFVKNIARIAHIRNIWMLGLTILGMSGCVQGALGYLPLFLRGQGWSGINADTATATFHTISLLCTIPIALISDRLGTRKKVLVASALMIMIGIGLLSFVSGLGVWLAVCMAGMWRDGFMAVFTTAIIETEGVGVTYAGTATGMVMIFSGVGNLIAPPLGNSLAAVAPGLPFAFWAGLLLIGFIGLLASREQAVRPVLATR